MNHTVSSHLRGMYAALVLLVGSTASAAPTDALVVQAANAGTDTECAAILRQIEGRTDVEARTVRGILFHNLARMGDDTYLERAVAELSEIEDPVARGYLGSVRTLEGGVANDRGNVFAATRLVFQGFDLMDEAVEESPDSIVLRFLRAENGLEVSEGSPFKRYNVIQGDVEFLLDHPELSGGDGRAHVLYLAGMVDLATGDLSSAIDWFAEIDRVAPESEWASKAEVFLWDLEE
jgi:hypothetical protein